MSTIESGIDQADELVAVATALSKSLRVRQFRLQPTLDAIVSTAVGLTGREAGLVVVEGGVLVPRAVVGQSPHLLDLWQQESGVGPCIEAAETQEPVRVGDTTTDTRWGGFAVRAVELGVRSMLCIPLWIDDRALGTLSLYADEAEAFGDQDERSARICGTLAAVALADARQAEQFQVALSSRDVIGQAKGILIERSRLTPDGAFAELARVSQSRNVKLLTVAQHLVDTGELL